MSEILHYNTFACTNALYIHWPFCPYKCHFCPFVAIAGNDQYMPVYHAALIKEIETFASSCSEKQKIDTIFFGGGTPSTYPDELLLDMSDRLKNVFLLNEVKEITIEVNPGTVKDEQLMIFKQAGINRLSIGVQSFNDQVLHSLNRLQKKSDVTWLINRAAQDFENISIDLIIGLPGVSQDEWKELIKTISNWPIAHVSIYFLTVHEDTQLYFKVKSEKVVLPPESGIVDLYLWTVQELGNAGFEQYEVSSFARSGFKAMHNSMYWTRRPYKGFGIGACSFDGQTRFQNQKHLIKYINAMNESQPITIFSEKLNEKQAHMESIMLAMRQSKGIAIDQLCFEKELKHQSHFQGIIDELIKQGLMKKIGENSIALTASGLAIHQTIVTKLSCEH